MDKEILSKNRIKSVKGISYDKINQKLTDEDGILLISNGCITIGMKFIPQRIIELIGNTIE